MLKKTAVIAGVASGLVLAGAGIAAADAGTYGAPVSSSGVALGNLIQAPTSGNLIQAPTSGNVIQAPARVPVNICGNSVSVVGLLNPAFGNTCH
ncbi:chaplin [Streptomyces yunnanensis]|uniref:Small secreted domain n=1 Tax=Streptomyces yunnanensis TaxID=156453 RepID=A0A9X8MSD5_9ACTN|nr:chaplin [Streptomyces yunnanensis]SHL62026.1 Small secreted domain [Streptomyces yunnanensis]